MSRTKLVNIIVAPYLLKMGSQFSCIFEQIYITMKLKKENLFSVVENQQYEEAKKKKIVYVYMYVCGKIFPVFDLCRFQLFLP